MRGTNSLPNLLYGSAYFQPLCDAQRLPPQVNHVNIFFDVATGIDLTVPRGRRHFHNEFTKGDRLRVVL